MKRSLEIIKEADNRIKTRVAFQMSGNLLDYAVYGFPDAIILEYSDNLQLEVNRRVKAISDKAKSFDFMLDTMLTVSANASAYSETANINEYNRVTLNPVIVNNLSDDELASVIFHEFGHVVACHSGIAKELTRIHKMIDNYLGTQDSMFRLVTARMFEAEADKISIALSYQAGYNPYAYRTALCKFIPQFDLDKSVFQYDSAQPSAAERIQRLDAISPASIVVRQEDYQRELDKLKNVQTIQDALKTEEVWYAKAVADCQISVDFLTARVLAIKDKDDAVVFQYERVLRDIREKNYCAMSLPYRRKLAHKTKEIYLLLAEAKEEVKKRLTLRKRAGVLRRNIIAKGKEKFNEWTR